MLLSTEICDKIKKAEVRVREIKIRQFHVRIFPRPRERRILFFPILRTLRALFSLKYMTYNLFRTVQLRCDKLDVSL